TLRWDDAHAPRRPAARRIQRLGRSSGRMVSRERNGLSSAGVARVPRTSVDRTHKSGVNSELREPGGRHRYPLCRGGCADAAGYIGNRGFLISTVIELPVRPRSVIARPKTEELRSLTEQMPVCLKTKYRSEEHTSELQSRFDLV